MKRCLRCGQANKAFCVVYGKQYKRHLFKRKPPEHIDWSKALKRSKRIEQVRDAKRVAELVAELYRIFKKHGQIKTNY